MPAEWVVYEFGILEDNINAGTRRVGDRAAAFLLGVSLDLLLTSAKNKMQNKIEELFIGKYIKKEKRERYLKFISNDKNRRKFTRELYHFKDLKWELFREIGSDENQRTAIQAKVIKKNLNDCHVISANAEFDRMTLAASDAIVRLAGEEGTILIFGNAEVVYYESEARDGRFISI